MTPDLVLPTRLEAIVSEDPGAEFIHEANTGRTVTRGQFWELVQSWAGALQRRSLCETTPLLTMLPTSVDALAVWLGASVIGAIEASVNTDNKGATLSYIINDVGARMMVVGPQQMDAVASVLEECPTLELIVILGDDGEPNRLPVEVLSADEFLDNAPTPSVTRSPEPFDISALVYTSGTTGPSKGVLLPWGQLYTTTIWIPPLDDAAAGGVIYAPFPTYHISLRAYLYRAALSGGQLVIRPRMSMSAFWSDIETYGCTFSGLLGTMGRILMSGSQQQIKHSLRYVTMVPVIPDVAEFENQFGVVVSTMFTQTEISAPLVSIGAAVPGSCGVVRPGVDVRLVDKNDYEVPHGEVGELIVRSDDPWTMNCGYWNKPSETAVAWRNGWFHTGDSFRVDDHGNFYFVDRSEDAIRRRGENISSTQLENLIVSHPAVGEVAAVGVKSPMEEDDVMIFVVPAPGHVVTASELHPQLVEMLPRFMCPRFIEVVDELPKTATLKVMKAGLRSRGPSVATWDAEAH